ncbi:hypothetical protein CANARDRAFT_173668 [[Candida] arabinofermentans NRRL YB-2248]|uniref:Pre-mRNA-processing factor 17 n=1 Tax=[Candida] arabinofermentans NRRL YB-2248 TaxID=983967 RepID=A0A1E4T7P9_9ASCO|nr:hypothetical protein CANARDRAFT_173668 [[Candida] arabinofermentans NRRL YB-2248]
MSLLTGYRSDSSGEEEISSLPPKEVTSIGSHFSSLANHESQLAILDPRRTKKTFTGYVQEEDIDAAVFKTNKRLYSKLGELADREGGGSSLKLMKSSKADARAAKQRRKDRGDAALLEGEASYKGPWASYEESSEEEFQSEEEEDIPEPVTDYSDTDEEEAVDAGKKPESTEYFGPKKDNYSYMRIPIDVKTNLNKEPGSRECYVPKKKIHTFDGHPKGTQAIQFFPKSGHLLLSCGNDNMIRLWDVYHKRQLLRTYSGHSKPVKHIEFNSTGSKFLSCSYDRYVKLWDTATGECVFKVKLHGIPNVAKFNPNNDSEFLVGMSNKKIEHYDIEKNEVIQTYDHHMQAINSLEFIDDNKSFVTSSSDKSLRIWNLKINMPIKQIADPKQQSMPYLKRHPNGKYYVAQSMDNNIIGFYARSTDGFKKNKKKQFSGHSSAGYTIGMQFTPDGKNLMSGDSNGYAYFWDWKSTKLISKLKVDTKMISCIDAHPQETSIVAMSGLSGKIFLYD